jgi:tetratricopeptide (TPR) repeat protein
MDTRFQAAVRAAVDEISAATDDAQAWRDLAMLYHAHTQLRLAEVCYARVLTIDVGDAEAWYGRALVAVSDGRPQDARAFLTRSLELAPDYAPGYYRLGQWLFAEGELDQAARLYAGAVQANANHPGGWIGLARVHLQRREHEEAAAILQGRILGGSNHGYGCQLLAVAYHGLGREEEARLLSAQGRNARPAIPDPRWAAILKRRASLSSHLESALMLVAQGRPIEAIPLMEAQVSEQKGDPRLLSNLATALLSANRLDEALLRAREAQVLDPHGYRPFLVEAQIVERGGTVEARRQALALTQHALALDPQAVPTLQYLGLMHARLGDDRSALEAFRRSSALVPDNVTFLLNVGLQERKLGLWDRALGTYERVFELSPVNLTATVGSGVALRETGRLHEAEQRLRSALSALERAGPAGKADLAKVLSHLAETLELQGREAEAAEYRARLR